MAETNMLANSTEVVRPPVTTIHIPISFKEGYQEITDHPDRILSGVVDSNAFMAGSWGAEITDEMKPAEEDMSSTPSLRP